MNLSMTVACFGIVVHVTAASAPAPAPAPNFCTHGLCLEISQLSGKVVEIETRTKAGFSEIIIRKPDGTTKVTYATEKTKSCNSQTGIPLKKIGEKFVGGGCLASPDDVSHWRYVSLEYVPALATKSTVELARLNFPILHFWSIDTAPVSFWESGYALRVGEGVSIKWPSR